MIRHRMAIQRQMAQERERQKALEAVPEAKEDTGPAGLDLMAERQERARPKTKPRKPSKPRKK